MASNWPITWPMASNVAYFMAYKAWPMAYWPKPQGLWPRAYGLWPKVRPTDLWPNGQAFGLGLGPLGRGHFIPAFILA